MSRLQLLMLMTTAGFVVVCVAMMSSGIEHTRHRSIDELSYYNHLDSIHNHSVVDCNCAYSSSRNSDITLPTVIFCIHCNGTMCVSIVDADHSMNAKFAGTWTNLDSSEIVLRYWDSLLQTWVENEAFLNKSTLIVSYGDYEVYYYRYANELSLCECE